MAMDLTNVPLLAENVNLGYETDWQNKVKLDHLDDLG
jgi:hypothetical protein